MGKNVFPRTWTDTITSIFFFLFFFSLQVFSFIVLVSQFQKIILKFLIGIIWKRFLFAFAWWHSRHQEPQFVSCEKVWIFLDRQGPLIIKVAKCLRLLDKRRKPNYFVTSCCFSIFSRTCGVWPIVFFYWRRRRRQSRSKSCSVDDTTFICYDRDDESSRSPVYFAGSNCARIIFKLDLYIVVTLMNGPPLPSWSISHTQLSRSRENWSS